MKERLTMDVLTPKQAYAAMKLFLDLYYQHTKSDDVGDILSGMSLLDDGDSADPGYWFEWLECVQKVQEAARTAEDWEHFEQQHLRVRFINIGGTKENSGAE